MAIDPIGLQQRLIDHAQSRAVDAAESVGEAARGVPEIGTGGQGDVPGSDFERLLGGDAQGRGNATAEAAPPVPPAADAPMSIGDRILANMSGVSTPDAAAPVGARPGIDIGDPMDSLHTQMRMAEIKAEVGLATSAVQKTTSATDTLLKAQ